MVNFFVSMGALEDLGSLHDDADEALEDYCSGFGGEL